MTTRVNHFQERLDENLVELRELYLSLYHDENAFEYFLGMLREAYRGRKGSLRRRDLAVLADPDRKFSQGMLGMMLYAENFAGDLNGVREKLPYLRECGVNYLHLMPLLDSPEGKSDGGYAVSDFRKVRPDLGTMEDLEELTAACHRRGIMVCLDFVMNHTSEDHEWAREARAGDPFAQARYFMYDSWDIPDEYSKTLPEVFPATAPGNYTWFDDCKKVVMTTFYPFQWDLNYANPIVFNDMTDNLLYLANRGVDVIRLDAVPYIWKTPGTNCRNLPEVHTLVRMMKLACRIVCPCVMLLGEVVMEPRYVVPYFGTREKPECDMLYNVTTMCTIWHTVATRDVRLLRHQIEQIEGLPAECLFQNYLRCHDDIGWGLDYGFLGWFGMAEGPHKKYLNDWFTGKWPGSPSRGELYNDFEALQDARLCGTTASLCGIESALFESGVWADETVLPCGDDAGNDFAALRTGIAADLMLHAMMLTLKGIPVLYSGDEIGMLNDYTYHNNPGKWDDSRFIHRGRFDWELAEKRSARGSVVSEIFSGLAELIRVRKSEDVFRADAAMYAVSAGDDRILGIGRAYGGRTLLGLFNFSPDRACAQVYEGAALRDQGGQSGGDAGSRVGADGGQAEVRDNVWRDVAHGGNEVIPLENGRLEYWLDPYGFCWLVK